ncbi:MATE family efflux transporter, partial [Streptomyces sp. P17]|uniref:MATE family efflux transporter n=1 Tax=Streptomyces sp. P17 TaxID=3074716 RepID=UPI0028F4264C
VAEGGQFVASNELMGWIGTQELAAHGIALQISAIAFMLHLGLSNAATVRVGQAKGRDDAGFMRDAGATVIGLSMAIALIVVTVFVLYPREIVTLYLDPLDP